MNLHKNNENPRKWFFSTLKEINSVVKIAYHSDGDITPITPDLIMIGLDVLNPIHPKSMDPASVEKHSGTSSVFGALLKSNTPFLLVRRPTWKGSSSLGWKRLARVGVNPWPYSSRPARYADAQLLGYGEHN